MFKHFLFSNETAILNASGVIRNIVFMVAIKSPKLFFIQSNFWNSKHEFVFGDLWNYNFCKHDVKAANLQPWWEHWSHDQIIFLFIGWSALIIFVVWIMAANKHYFIVFMMTKVSKLWFWQTNKQIFWVNLVLKCHTALSPKNSPYYLSLILGTLPFLWKLRLCSCR